MDHSAPASADDLGLIVAWPSESAAAEMLGVPRSALARREDLEREDVDSGGRRYRPTAVLRAGAEYKRRSLNALAAKLIAHARESGDRRLAAGVRSEIDDFFAERVAEPVDEERILKEARRALPRQLFLEVQRAFEQGVIQEPELQGAEVDFGAQSVEAR